MENEYKMYIFVNSSLGMGKGKIGAQVGHVVCDITNEILVRAIIDNEKYFKTIYENYRLWRSCGQRKIVLKATQEEMDLLKNHANARVIYDAGHTQIEAGSLTVIGFWPSLESKPPLPIDELKKYKLM